MLLINNQCVGIICGMGSNMNTLFYLGFAISMCQSVHSPLHRPAYFWDLMMCS